MHHVCDCGVWGSGGGVEVGGRSNIHGNLVGMCVNRGQGEAGLVGTQPFGEGFTSPRSRERNSAGSQCFPLPQWHAITPGY